MKTQYNDIRPYLTKDGSTIRELMHPALHGNRRQSLAEAIIPPGQTTHRHIHHHTEELYHITSGCGTMRLGPQTLEVAAGDTVSIPPGTPHQITNSGTRPLKLLCCCSPPYTHEDTELIKI
jgi:mannose-6-phosphate isomerase-like protein (cupin superfamily)